MDVGWLMVGDGGVMVANDTKYMNSFRNGHSPIVKDVALRC